MVFTAVTEVGPDQWMGSVMTDTVGIRGIIYLVYTAGIMFVMRTYAGTLVRFMTPFVLLAVSCVLGGGGILWLSYVTTPGVAFAAATVFGMGKALLWPILLGVTAERYPKGGAFLLALMGGTGMVAAGLAGPVLGHVYDTYTVRNLPAEVARVVVVDGRYSPAARDKLQSPVALAAVREAEKHGAAMTFRCVALTPVLPLVVYVLLFFYHRSQGGYRTIRIGKARREG
jgi:MFS family permease